MQKPRLSFWQIWNMSFGFLGIQFGWGLQLANMSPIYKYLHAEESSLPYLWLAGPITGLLIQPIIGSMSDRTWNRLGRRRPYFLVGAILASIALFIMPNSSAVWMAAGLLWILDASINITMEPFRAFVADKLPEEQRTLGFVMQSWFIGIGQTLANALPYLFTALGVVGVMATGIPLSVDYSFKIGAIVFLVAVLWTVITTEEYPPEDLAAFERMRREHKGIGAGFKEIFLALAEMPTTMKQLAVVQFFTWFALPCMWQFFGIAIARHVFGAPNEGSPRFAEGTEWGGLCFAAYNVVCFLIAFELPWLVNKTSRKTVHMIALICGGHRSDLGAVYQQQIHVVCEYGGRWYCVGFDPVDAVRDAFDCGAVHANGCVHGRVQPVHRDPTDRDVAHRAENLQQPARWRSAQRGGAGWY